MKPTRDPRVTLDDLVEVLLNKGAVLHLDLIVAVADIPLIGVSLRAAVAGMETMLEYGMLRQWDADTRAWAMRSAARHELELRAGEESVVRMYGGHLLDDDFHTTWRPGTVHLTDRRLVVLRRDPREVLWEAELSAVRAVRLESERTVGGESRTRVRVETADGAGALLSAADPERLRDLLVRTCPGPLTSDGPRSPLPGPDERALVEGHLWYREPRRDGPLWRGGNGRLTPAGLVWKSPLDARPALVLPAADVTAVRPGAERGPGGEGTVFTVETGSRGTVTLAADEPRRWVEALGSPRDAPALPSA
ncbi:gas vesicle protein GvpJ [Streptomyces megasporus]|uniref:gas vesicle protein GvpJ n=1 Tax=Streptomyces megasporus TaxID=44060 RepID=UPI0006896E5D|nr:gas vesicle protein GvpJ [Streptomyces megasporus]